MNDQRLIGRKMWRHLSVIYLVVLVQTAVPGASADTSTNDLEANDMYRDLLSQRGAPEILSYVPEVELNAGENFQLFCKGAEEVVWKKRRTDDEEIEDDSITDEPFETLDYKKSYGRSITINAATASIVGRYYCIYKESLLKNVDHHDGDNLIDLESAFKASSTYIYVKDPKRPLVPIELTAITVMQYEDALIPCKPSSKDVKVELVKDEQRMPLEKFHFNERMGFLVTVSRLDQSGLYLCSAPDEDSDETIVFHLEMLEQYDFEQAVTEYLKRPRIETNFGDIQRVGEMINLTCVLEVMHGVKFDMKWILPNDKTAKEDERTTLTTTVIVHPDRVDYNLGILTLTINNVNYQDSGNYRCNAVDHNKHDVHKTHRVEIVKPGHSFINMSEDNGLDNITAGTRFPIKIVIKYIAHPQNVHFQWFKDDSEVPLEMGSKYEMTDIKQRVTLTIKEPSIQDFGLYKLKAENDGTTAELKIMVYVTAPPVTKMDPVVAKPRQAVTFTCTVIGYPKSTVYFAFVACDNAASVPNCTKATEVRPGDVKEHATRTRPPPENKQYISIDEYSFIAETPGHVICIASNTKGRDMSKQMLLVTDLEEPVTIVQEAPQTEVTTGDDVEIVCAASVYNFTDKISFFHNDEELSEDDSRGISFTSWYQPFAYRRRLFWKNVNQQHNGEIRCQAEVVASDEVVSKEVRLTVLVPIHPSIIDEGFHEKRVVRMTEPNQFECRYQGTPTPVIDWRKDGDPLELENDTRIVLNGSLLSFQFVKEEDAGDYTCHVKNKLGFAEKTWTLEIRTVAVRKTWVILVLSLLLILFLAVVFISLFYYKKKREVKALKEAGLANFEEGNLEQMNPEISLDEQADLLPYKTEYEFPKEKLKLGKQLGAGAFGVVMKATAAGIMVNEDETTVAVKMVKKQTDNEVMRALISELKIMVHLGQHLNVVNLLGAVTKNIAKRELMVIVEYCRFGNVQNFLLRHRPYFIDQINSDTGEIDPSIEKNQFRWSKAGYMYNSGNPAAHYPKSQMNSKGYVRHSGVQNMGMVDSCNTEATIMTSVEGEEANTANSNEPLWRSNYGMDYKGPARSVTTTDLVCWASQVACGMEYLASRKVLHGDLAARNILLCDDNIVKICDFGLARSMYKSDNYKKKGEAPLPFKWLALECISDNIFGTYSDVWAYGIVLWEFFSLAKTPYPGMEANQELYNKLRDGYRMDKPSYSNQDIYDIMLNCWNVKPDSRPTFKDLKSRFNAMLPEELRNHYIDLNEPYLAMNAEKEQRGEPDYLASLGPPEEQAPSAPPNYVNGIILPLPPISDNPDYLKMSSSKSEDSEDSHFDFASFNNSQPSPTLKNNLDSHQQGKRHKKKGIPEEIPMLHNRGRAGQGSNSDSEPEPISPTPMVRTTKIQQPDHEYTNLKKLDRHAAGGGSQADTSTGAGNDAFSNPGYVIVNTVNEKK